MPGAEVAVRLGLPQAFLAKVLGELVRKGLLVGEKGAAGGVSLARPAGQITPLEVIDALEGPDFLRGCVLGFPACGEETPCLVHTRWIRVRQELLALFGGENLAEIAARGENGERREQP